MLNNGGPPQNDAYSGMQQYQQYGQDMASSLSGAPGAYGGQQKRTAMQPGLQPGIQPNMSGVRQPAQRANVTRYTGTQYPANRGAPHQAGMSSPNVASSSIAPMRQGQSQYTTNSSGLQVCSAARGAACPWRLCCQVDRPICAHS